MMDRHTCKLCFRRFSNGRALGGHMRSHVTSAKPQLHDPASPSSSASASHRELEASNHAAEVADTPPAALMVDPEAMAGVEEGKQLAYYGLRENPRKSFRLVDPEFSSTFPAVDYAAAAAAAASVVLQDRESETESSKPPSLRRRSKRLRRAPQLPPAATKREPSFDPEPVSSISDATPEEDVARCLMMLSRDSWTNSLSPAAKSADNSDRDEVGDEEEEEEDGEEQQQSDDSDEELIAVVRSRKGGRSRYQCATCRKVFRSYQALGGHRASHKKVRACTAPQPTTARASVAAEGLEEEEDDHNIHPHLDKQIQDADSEVNAAPSTGSTDRRIHECPVCFRIFGSGQALGGHKRSHLAYASSTTVNPSVVIVTGGDAARNVAAATEIATGASAAHVAGHTKKLVGEGLIDLNLPPPLEEEVEKSAVYDLEQ